MIDSKQVAGRAVSEMIESAKALLMQAKVLADDYGISVAFENLYEEAFEDVGNWNSSSANC